MTEKHSHFKFDRNAGSLNEKAYAALEELIVTGVLAPGSQWSENALAEKIELGRTPTREALQKLSYHRLVRIAPRQGIFISDIDYQGQLKIIQARREIEHLIVVQAAQLATSAERESLRLMSLKLGSIKKTKNMHDYMRLHFAMTHVLGEASRNVYAAEFYSVLQTLSRRFLYFHQDRYVRISQICEFHIRQLESVIEGNAKEAVEISIARNDYAENFAREIIMDLIANSGVKISLV